MSYRKLTEAEFAAHVARNKALRSGCDWQMVWHIQAKGACHSQGFEVTPAERAAHMAEVARKRQHRKRVENRAAMPESAHTVDEFTRVFGKLPAGRVWEDGRMVEWGNRWWDK